MYADPRQVRDNRVPVYVSDYTHERLMHLVAISGSQKGTVAHDAILRGIDLLLHELESPSTATELTGPKTAHSNA